MKVKLEATDPGEIAFTLTATMRLKDWVELRRRISGESAYVHGINALNTAISELVYQAQKTFQTTLDEEEGE